MGDVVGVGDVAGDEPVPYVDRVDEEGTVRGVALGATRSERQMVHGSSEASDSSVLLVISRPPEPFELMPLEVQMGVRGATKELPVVYTSPPDEPLPQEVQPPPYGLYPHPPYGLYPHPVLYGFIPYIPMP